jgi:hypothetical protein
VAQASPTIVDELDLVHQGHEAGCVVRKHAAMQREPRDGAVQQPESQNR